MILLWTTLAWAADCRPMEEPEFRALVLDSQMAIAGGNVESHEEFLSTIEEQIPCFQFAPAPRAWADYLVSRAILDFYKEEDWETPLAAALRLDPKVDRPVAPAHPIYSWAPEPLPEAEPVPLPEEAEHIFVNGRASATYPPEQGLVLVQREDDGWWKTQLVEDAHIDEDWLTTPVEPPPRVLGWGVASLQLNHLLTDQRKQGWNSDYIPDSRDPRGLGSLELRGGATFLLPAGIWGRLVIPGNLQLNAAVGELELAAIWTPRRWQFGGGIGFIGQDVIQGDPSPTDGQPDRQLHVMRFPFLLAGVRTGDRLRFDGRVIGGWRPGLGRALVDGGLSIRTGQVRLRGGLEFGAARSLFEQPLVDDPDARTNRRVAVWSIRSAVKFGVAFGSF